MSAALPRFETLLVEVDQALAVVTLNRPAVLNALNAQMFTDLEAAFTLLSAEDSVRVVVITGAGEKAFAAGADIAELAHTDARAGAALAHRGHAVMGGIETCGKPVLACINGFALGGGCELALCCHLRLASATARLGLPEGRLGLIPGYGGTQRLPRLVGAAAALKLLLTGAMIDAREAERIGLVDEVVPPADLLPRARALAAGIATQAPLAVAACLQAVREGAALPFQDALTVEAGIFARLHDTADKREGVAAFLEKRKPTFTGR